MVTTTESPDGERLARVETRLENLETLIGDLRNDLREFRSETRENFREFRSETHENLRELRTRMDKQFLWVLGIMFTMWISLFVLIATFMIAIINKLS